MAKWKKNLMLLMFPALAGNMSYSSEAMQGPAQNDANEPLIFSICTERGAEILREDKINATITTLPFTMQEYQGGHSFCNEFNASGGQPIQIRRRGYSSDRFAKKQYQVEFVDAQGEEQKVALLDLPAADEWVLNAPFVDRAYVRNALAYEVGRKIGPMHDNPWFAPKLRFVEVFINDEYRGVYGLTEKIQRGKNHIDIPKVDINKPGDLSYILEISAMTSDVKTKHHTSIEWSYPGKHKLERWALENPQATAELKEAIIHDVETFEDVLKSKLFAHPELGYASYIDIPSFIDYFIIREAFKDVDGFRRSAYFFKGRDHKLHMGPLWDFNIAFGNMRWWDMSDVGGWTHGNIPFYPKKVFWFKRLLRDAAFVDLVVERYHALRAPGMPLDMNVLNHDIDSLVASLGSSPARDQERWEGTYGLIEAKIMNTKHKSDSLEGHVAILKSWLGGRLGWLDRHMPDLYKKAKKYKFRPKH